MNVWRLSRAGQGDVKLENRSVDTCCVQETRYKESKNDSIIYSGQEIERV